MRAATASRDYPAKPSPRPRAGVLVNQVTMNSRSAPAQHSRERIALVERLYSTDSWAPGFTPQRSKAPHSASSTCRERKRIMPSR